MLVSLQTQFQFKVQHVDAVKVKFQIRVVDGNTTDIDFDFVSVTIHSSPVNEFILLAEFADCLGVGAVTVQTSHTFFHSDFNDLNITDIVVVNEIGIVIIGGTHVQTNYCNDS